METGRPVPVSKASPLRAAASRAEGLSEQRPLGRQPPGLAGPLADSGLLGMPARLTSPQPPTKQHAGQGGDATDHGQQHG
jgi:hypothetical protein